MVVSAEGNLHHSEQLLNEERYVTLSGQRLPVYCLLLTFLICRQCRRFAEICVYGY